ncbi:MAG: hypothetical protein JEZ04_22255 [Spirochaetales bacterium]|nr:hypothetical protein [Spirochaetales bacterium]
MYELKDKEFEYISEKTYNYSKINLTEKKRSLVVSRLSKRIRLLGLSGFPEYIKYLNDSKDEFQHMIDALSTNYSLFFREPHHLDFLTNVILPQSKGKNINLWSAAASTGQEIYSILICILEYQHKTGIKQQYKLYASDISGKALTAAARGVYPRKDTEKIDNGILKKYFLTGSGEQSDQVKIKKDLIKQVSFFKLNLTDSRYSLPIMDIIFLRNVIIYFDGDTKKQLVARLADYITPGGYLIIGHSESLSGITDKFTLVGQTIYQRNEQ